MHEMAMTGQADSIHVMGQLAACRRSVGVALMPQTALFELRGRPDELGALAARLTGRPMDIGPVVRIDGGWWQSITSRRALVLGDPAEPLVFTQRLRALADAAADVAVEDLSAGHAAVVLAGRLAPRLAATPAARLARPVMAVRDGDDYQLLVLPDTRAADSRHVLLEAGRADGAIAVGPTAAELYRAARPAPRRRVTNASLIPIDPTTTGALPS
jgi:hypothetical protein